MAKRASKEEQILEYFKTAPLAKVEVVSNLIKPILKERQADEGKTTPKPRAVRASKGQSAEGANAGTSAAA